MAVRGERSVLVKAGSRRTIPLLHNRLLQLRVHHDPAEGALPVEVEEEGTNMKSFSKILLAGIASAFALTGCYTQIMTPQEFVDTRREKSSVHSDASSALNYNQNCYSCHSKAELDDRYIDWKYYGVTTAHNGIVVNPMVWNDPYAAPVYEPDPYGWYNPAPSQPWWLPPAVIVRTSPAGSSGVSSKPESRPRTDGSTRDPRGENTRSEPIPAQTQSQPTGGNTSAPTPSPAATTTPPAQTPPAATTSGNERARSDSGSSTNTNRTRDDGSTRSGGGRSR